MSLYQLEREGDFRELVETLHRSQNPTIRQRAAEIIGGLFESDEYSDEDLVVDEETPDEIDTLEEDDRDRRTVVDELIEVIKTDDDERVRAAAIDALDHHSKKSLERVVEELSGADLQSAADWVAAKAFAEVLDDEKPELRMAAATGLGRVGDPNVTSALVERLTDSDVRVRTRVAVACGRIGDPRAVEALEARLLEDPSIDVRSAAAEALGKIQTDGSLTALLDAPDDETETVRRVVADALGQFGSIRPVNALVDCLDDESEAVRRTAMYSIVELLSNAPSQQSHDVRETAADRLESATADEVIPPLSEILTESSGAPQRRNAAWLLGRVVGTEYESMAREALLGALGDEDGMTGQFAATSLARLNDPALESALLELVRDDSEDPDARSKALFVLGKVGGDDARTELGEFVDRTDDDKLREGAFSALSKLGGVGGGGLQ